MTDVLRRLDQGRDPDQADRPMPASTDPGISAPSVDDDVDRWSDRVSRAFVPLHVTPLGAGPFRASLQIADRGPVSLARITGTAQHVRHGQREIDQSGKTVAYLNLQLGGVGHVRGRLGETSTSVGGAALVLSHDSFDLDFPTAFEQLCITVQQDWLSERLGFPLDALAVRAVDTRRGIGRILRAAVDALSEADAAEEAAACAELFAQALAGALRVRPFEREKPALLLPAIRQLIRRRLGEYGLTPADAARELGCSLSTLHRHCQMAGSSFGTMLWDQRLAAAAEALRATPPSHRRIELVALACGFGDAAHFARRFKARFGVTPSAWR